MKFVYPQSTAKRRLVVEFDQREDYEGGTPVMVRLYDGKREIDCCTWNIIDAGFSMETTSFTDSEWKWFHSLQPLVEEFLSTLGTHK